MEIISTPIQRSSAYREALFKLSAAPSETIDLEIREHSQGRLLGKKRLSGQSSYTVNVSNYAQRYLEVSPYRNNLTLFTYPANRMAAIRIQAGEKQGNVTLTSGLETIYHFEKLSKAPDGLGITLQQADEISLYTDISRLSAEVVLSSNGTNRHVKLAEKNKQDGLCSLYLCMPHVARKIQEAGMGNLSDYAQMEIQIITEYDELVFSRKYKIEETVPRTMRLCWWNRYGQIDYYTFKQTGAIRFHIDKQQVYTQQGYKTTGCQAETLWELSSDYLNNESLQWLHEISAAPKVWIDSGTAFQEVEILTRQAVMGVEELSRLEISVTPRQRTIYQHL